MAILAGVGLLLAALVSPVSAQSAGTSGETRNLFDTAGEKQTNTDFEPAPDKIRTDFGTLRFEGGAFPTEESIDLIYDEMDLQRATQAYMDFMPALSVYGIVKSHIRDFGFKTSSDIVVAAGPGWRPSELYLTGNNATVYACASLDLKVDGPTVVEIPPGMYGTADDALFKFLVDFGFVGPDKGDGGKYLFLPPGYSDTPPEGYFAVPSPSYRIWVMMRGFGEVGTGEQAVDWFRKNLKRLPAGDGSPQGQLFERNRRRHQLAGAGGRFCIRDAERNRAVRTRGAVRRRAAGPPGHPRYPQGRVLQPRSTDAPDS